MVDQNSNSPVQNTHKPKPSGDSARKDALKQPNVLQAGQTMLIIALTLMLLVVCAICLHLYLRRRRRRRSLKDVCPIKKVKEMKEKKRKKEKEGKKEEKPEQPELHSKEKHVAELPGTPLCEMGESEPRHEMEDAEVPERHLQSDSETQIGSDTSSCCESDGSSMMDSGTASQIDLEAGISWYDASEERVEPDSRQFAMYWSRGI